MFFSHALLSRGPNAGLGTGNGAGLRPLFRTYLGQTPGLS